MFININGLDKEYYVFLRLDLTNFFSFLDSEIIDQLIAHQVSKPLMKINFILINLN